MKTVYNPTIRVSVLKSGDLEPEIKNGAWNLTTLSTNKIQYCFQKEYVEFKERSYLEEPQKRLITFGCNGHIYISENEEIIQSIFNYGSGYLIFQGETELIFGRFGVTRLNNQPNVYNYQPTADFEMISPFAVVEINNLDDDKAELVKQVRGLAKI